MTQAYPDATQIAASVRGQQISAKAVVSEALTRIADQDSALNCFTTVLADRAIADAEAIDHAIGQGKDPGVLAGVPFAVKDLYDIAGVTTLAGSKINAERPAATQDATLITRLKQAGAVLVGGLNMDEYAYGFVTENSHYGDTHNPHDLSRVAGGSSGGSAAAVAGGLVPIALGSDTNGSIRVPASFCGIFGLKPTYGRLSRSGAYLFVSSLDHLGPFARSTRDLAQLFDLMQGPDSGDPVCTDRPPQPCLPQLDRGIDGLRIAIAADYFQTGAEPEVMMALEQVATALNATQSVTIPAAGLARAAAFLITASEGSNLHLEDLRNPTPGFRSGYPRSLSSRSADPSHLVFAGAAVSPLVSRPGTGTVHSSGCNFGSSYTLSCAPAWPKDADAERGRSTSAPQFGRLHSAAFVHWAADRGGSGAAARTVADRDSSDCGSLQRGFGPASRCFPRSPRSGFCARSRFCLSH